ncbi:MAG: tRNA (N6-threonylcarbamoyladenosine(37)-N6)-methyltransferase TrmO [Candidatus Heimdallarchaeota archaeon]|nr:MAG: tRNA (N6-threonylcarbamoyladenosine(37)-N6)-methyltransferase TrmO [Candidatus Heimdallarchaeota archaeon]
MQNLSFDVKPIGRVISHISNRKNIPLQGVQAQIEVFEEYEPALEGIDRYSHLIILSFLHLSDRTVLQASPRKIDPTAPTRGVFSMRAPVRPNPISMNVVKVIHRKGRILTVDHVDLVTDTPVIDIKPYIDWDCVFSARQQRKTSEKLSRDERIEDFLRQAANFHGGVCPGIMIGVLACVEVFPNYIPLSRLKSKELIVIVESDRCIADAMTAITGCTLGRRSLKFKDFGKMAVTFIDQKTDKAYRLALSSGMNKISPDSSLEVLMDLDAREIFTIAPVEVLLTDFDLPGLPKKKVTCTKCGETVRDNREIITIDKPECKYCAGIERYYNKIA